MCKVVKLKKYTSFLLVSASPLEGWVALLKRDQKPEIGEILTTHLSVIFFLQIS